MTDHTKSAGEVEARDTLRSEIAHIVASTVAGTCCRKTGGKGGDNARPDCECLAASSDIMMKLDAYLAKLTATKAEPSRIAEDVAWLRTQAVSTAKAMTMLQDHRTADYKARGDLDANYKGIEAHETREWNLANRLEILLSHITAIEADRDRLAKLWSDKRDDCDTATQEVERLQSDKDRLTKALEEIVGMTYAGAPDIYMKRIARAVLNPSKPGEG